ncbi:MAG: leucyl/phenylalanyl-tRNA--protein transferase [Thermodesulfovibrio sp.]|nr:leucyl/phenylalanyl-tRNA--protein transferase [Thermodesulfovibrio sp.]
MTVFLLHDALIFPNPELAEPDGLLAIGGDLSTDRLLLAYKSGIFPWYNELPILWWCPPKRPVIFPSLFRLSRSLYQIMKKNAFKVTFDKDFYGVIEKCASIKRKDSNDTWITDEMREAYIKLHSLGFAHSVEVWKDDKLVGGLYGVSIGKAFFGESMFSLVSNASKVALACLVEFLIKNSFYFIDCQITNEHLSRMGAIEVPRNVFLKILNEATSKNFIIEKWSRENLSTRETAFFLMDKLIKRSSYL